jgi:hypothetical protein
MRFGLMISSDEALTPLAPVAGRQLRCVPIPGGLVFGDEAPRDIGGFARLLR